LGVLDLAACSIGLRPIEHAAYLSEFQRRSATLKLTN
jgi:hypothetical protein